jgi:cytoskeletal protein CcmA (bactofilin family)
LFVAGDVSMNANLYTLGRTVLQGDVSTNTRLFVSGDVSMNSNLYTLGRTVLQGDVSMNTRLFVAGDVSMNNRLFVSGDVSMNSRLFVTGNIFVNGVALSTSGGSGSFNGGAVSNDVFLNNRLFVLNDVSMNTRLFVSGDVSMNSNLYTLGRTVLQGDVSMNTRLFVAGDVSMNTRLFVAGDVSMNSNLYTLGRTFLQGDVSMNSRLFVGNDVIINGRLNVYEYTNTNLMYTNVTTTNYTLIIAEDISLNGRLNVNYDASLNARLFVAGDVSMNSNLYTLGRTVHQGDVSMNTRLFVAGDVSMNSRLFVSGNIYLPTGGNVYVGGSVLTGGGGGGGSSSTATTTTDLWGLTNFYNSPPAIAFSTSGSTTKSTKPLKSGVYTSTEISSRIPNDDALQGYADSVFQKYYGRDANQTELASLLPELKKQYTSKSGQTKSTVKRIYKDGNLVNDDSMRKLLSSFCTGDVDDVMMPLQQLMSSSRNKKVIWIPFHMFKALDSFGNSLPDSGPIKKILPHIISLFIGFRDAKTYSGLGWENLFLIALLIRCISSLFDSTLVPLDYSFYKADVSYNENFNSSKAFSDYGKNTDIQEFVSNFKAPRSYPHIAIYAPTNAQFPVYDAFLVAHKNENEKKIYGYQLKESNDKPIVASLPCIEKSFLILGRADVKETYLNERKWTVASDKDVDIFFGESGRHWTSKEWKKLSKGTGQLMSG